LVLNLIFFVIKRLNTSTPLSLKKHFPARAGLSVTFVLGQL